MRHTGETDWPASKCQPTPGLRSRAHTGTGRWTEAQSRSDFSRGARRLFRWWALDAQVWVLACVWSSQLLLCYWQTSHRPLDRSPLILCISFLRNQVKDYLPKDWYMKLRWISTSPARWGIPVAFVKAGHRFSRCSTSKRGADLGASL